LGRWIDRATNKRPVGNDPGRKGGCHEVRFEIRGWPAAGAFLAAAFLVAAPVLAQESPELKDEIKKAIGKKWEGDRAVHQLFETAHPTMSRS